MNANPEVPATSTQNKEEITATLVRELFNYDPKTGVFTNRITRCNRFKKDDVCGAIKANGYRSIKIFHERHMAHRLAWLYMTGSWPTVAIDHINGIQDDNRFSNLREATVSKNACNSRKSKSNTSGFKGVTWCAITSMWRARITFEGKHRQLGRFHKLEDAVETVRTARDQLHGDFANHG